MTFHKILSFLKKALIGYCILIFILETIKFFFFESPSRIYYYGYCSQISVYFLLIAIVTIKKKWMWYFGIFYFIIATIDLLVLDISSGIWRQEFSGFSPFQFSNWIGWAIYEMGYNCRRNYFTDSIAITYRIAEVFMFPLAIILFFTNPVRKRYGLPPIFKFKN